MKLAIVGASYLQLPLIKKAKSRGIETHVFAWAAGDVGEEEADYFYPVSIVEQDEILKKCQEIGIDGICTIASDLAVITVNYVAAGMGLIGNTLECTEVSTNKNKMRRCFEENNDPSPRSMLVESVDDLSGKVLSYPMIVKPVDRSGSRGITKIEKFEQLEEAIERAKDQGFLKKALVEEFATGQEYSVEFISWKGEHHFITITKKYTTGAPNFIETAHIEPAGLDDKTRNRVKDIVTHALNSIGVQYGASHSEVKISENGDIRIIEIGGRMGGDCIGSSLVQLSTGFDFVSAVIDIALGIEPKVEIENRASAAVRFVFNQKDIDVLDRIKKEHPDILIEEDVKQVSEEAVTDSGSRFGYYLFASEDRNIVESYLE